MNLTHAIAGSARLPNAGVMALLAAKTVQREYKARAVPAFITARTMARSAATIVPIPPDATVEEVTGLDGDSFLCHPSAAHLLPHALAAVGEGGVLILDNGGYGLWQSDLAPTDQYIDGYWQWAVPFLSNYQSVYALIPDMVAGSEADNMSLIVDAYVRSASVISRCIPVWHPHESDEQLEEIAFMGFEVIALGASPVYPCADQPAWRQRLDAALAIVRDASNRAGRHIALHVLGTPDPSVGALLPSTAHKLEVDSHLQQHLWHYRHMGTLPCRTNPPS